jgi:nucleoside-diphosphate-sugar epimerase
MDEKKSALIGYTGFVGSNLLREKSFTALFNSKNINTIVGHAFDTVVCAGVSAVKWQANKNPEQDWASIQQLLEPLKQVRAERFVLISTIDVYPNPNDVDEDTRIHGLENHAYGRHRLAVEDFVRERFGVHHIVRLPGLFGTGLKKNVIFDLIHNNCIDTINPESSFQYYNLSHLSADIDIMIKNELPLVNMAAEPISTHKIISRFFSEKQGVGTRAGPRGRYDMHTKYSRFWSKESDFQYQYSSEEVLAELGRFVCNCTEVKDE